MPGPTWPRRCRRPRAGPASCASQLIEFVTAESTKVPRGEWLPGTTEVLESLFGKLKSVEHDQSKSGFTGLVLSLGAMVTRLTPESIAEAMDRVRVSDVRDWCAKKLGRTVQSVRRQLMRPTGSATKMG